MVFILLLLLIYLAFISLGLPDSILGVSLPSMLAEWGLPLSAGGIISMTVIGSAIVSSFISGYIIDKIGTGKIVFLSCLMTGGALLGISFAPSFFWLIFLAIPLGLGGGAVDTALNNYVALHYKAHHMNWLHSFWGVGATLGPVIMSFSLMNHNSWRLGYRNIALIQLSLSLVLMLTLPLWNKAKNSNENVDCEKVIAPKKKMYNPFKIRGVKSAFGTLMLYCTVESGIGLWGSSYLIQSRGFSIENAASWLAFYYGGITAGRFLSGFVSFKFSNTQLIRMGILSSFTGILILLFPVNSMVTGMAIVFIGLGLAPIFPSMLHETPIRFGKDLSQILIGYQMGFAYVGSAVLSPLLGVLLQYTVLSLFPFYLIGLTFLLFILSEILNSRTAHAY